MNNGIKTEALFWAERIEEKRQSERDLIGTGGKIDELYKVIEFRPNIKVMKYLPAADEMDAIKNENIYDGFLIIFDTMPDDVTDLKEIIRLRPRLKFSSGKNPLVIALLSCFMTALMTVGCIPLSD